MVLKPPSSFCVGDRVRVEIPEFNLQHGAGDEYPHVGTGTIAIPTRKVMVPVEPEKPKKTKKTKSAITKEEKSKKAEVQVVARCVIEPDLKKFAVLQEQRQAWVQLDKPFLRAEREETPWRSRDKARLVTELAIPEWLLKPLKAEEDFFKPAQ